MLNIIDYIVLMYPTYTIHNPFYNILYIQNYGTFPISNTQLVNTLYVYLNTTDINNTDYETMRNNLITSIISNNLSYYKKSNRLFYLKKPIRPLYTFKIAMSVLSSNSIREISKEHKLPIPVLNSIFRTPLFQHYLYTAMEKKYEDNVKKMFNSIKPNIEIKQSFIYRLMKSCRKENIDLIKGNDNYHLFLIKDTYDMFIFDWDTVIKIRLNEPIYPQLVTLNKYKYNL